MNHKFWLTARNANLHVQLLTARNANLHMQLLTACNANLHVQLLTARNASLRVQLLTARNTNLHVQFTQRVILLASSDTGLFSLCKQTEPVKVLNQLLIMNRINFWWI